MKDIFIDDVSLRDELFECAAKILCRRLLPDFSYFEMEYRNLKKYSDSTKTVHDLFICCDTERERARLEKLVTEIMECKEQNFIYDKFIAEFEWLVKKFNMEEKQKDKGGKFPFFKNKQKSNYPFKELNDFFNNALKRYKSYGEQIKNKLTPLKANEQQDNISDRRPVEKGL